MANDVNTRYGNLLTNIKSGHIHKKTLVLDGKETITGSQNINEKFVSSGGDKSGTEIFDLGKKFKAKGTGQEIKTGEVTGETKTEGTKPANLQKLEELTEKYKHLSGTTMAVMSGIGVLGAITAGIAGSGAFGSGVLMSSALGAAVGGPNDGHYEQNEITKSGVEKKFIQEHHSGAVDYTTDYNLPDGTRIHKEYHTKPKEYKTTTDMVSPNGLAKFIFGGSKDISESLSAVDKEGHKLDAKVVKDENTGLDRIQVANSNGTITMLDPSSLGFSVVTPKHNYTAPAFSAPSSLSDKKKMDTPLGSSHTHEYISKKETVNPDGSIEMILNEDTSFFKQQVKDPLHYGQTKEEIVPERHSYTKVNISPDGDTSVEKVDENYKVKLKDGILVGKRTKFADTLVSMIEEKQATSINTEGEFFIGKASKPEKGEKVAPFITRGQIKESYNNLVEKRIEDARKDLLNNEYVSTWADFAQGMKDAEKMTGKKLDVIGFDACLMANAEVADELKGNSKKPEVLEAKGSDGTIYLASTDGKLRALTPEGEKKWGYDKNFYDGITATPLPDKDNLYVLDKKNTLHCVKSGSHSALDVWDTDIKGEIIGDPSIDKDGNINIPVKMEEKIVQRTINPKNGMEVKARIVHI